MKIYKILSLALLLILTMGTLKAQTAKDGLVWVFNGDSITDSNRYSNYMEAYFHLRYPQYKMHFRSVGRGGARLNDMLQSSSGQGPHYKNRAYSFSPDVISIMYGHNDGAYSNAKWRSILNNTLDEIEANSSSDIILLGAHPKYGGGKPYLEDFNKIFTDVGATRGYAAVDTWAALKPIWNKQSGASLGVFDGIHPGPTGHACMAAALLKGLNEERLVSSATINASNGRLTASERATISDISTTGNGITFSRLDDRLPMAFDPKSYPALNFCPDILDMNQYMLTVSGLASGTYDVYVDGVKSASDISSSTLASGWNMTQMNRGPIYDQLNDVINAIRDKQGIGRTSLDRVGPPWKGIEKYISSVKSKSVSYSSMISSTVGVRAELDAFDVIINNLAQPIQRNFELRRAGAAPTEYSLTTNAVNGRVSPTGGSYSSGVSVALTAIPDKGYVFDRWSGDATGTTAYTQITINNNKTVTATFVANPSNGSGSGSITPTPTQYTLTTQASNGSITPADGRFVEDTQVSLVATPDSGYQFDRWSSNVSANAVTMNSHQLVVATFSEIPIPVTQYTLTTRATNGVISPSSGTFEKDSTITLIVTPNANYQFDGWGGDLTGNATSAQLLMDSNMTVTASFSLRSSGSVGTANYTPPAGIPAPTFGINETVESVYGSDTFYTHYIDNDHPNATDRNNATGSLNKPRKTIPQTLAAGSVVEVRGQSYVDTRNEIDYQLNGTATAPVFIRGVSNTDRVVILGQARSSNRTKITFQGQYFIVENFDFYNKVQLKFDSNSRYGSLRNSELHNPVSSTGAKSPTLSASGEHIVIYNNEIHDNVQSETVNAHGIQVSSGSNKLWVLNNKIYNNGGDGFQTCQQCETNKPTNIYIGDNEFFGDSENAIDLKYASDVIVSQNKLYRYTTSSSKAIVTIGRAGTTDNVWLLFNEIHNGNRGVKVEYANDLWLIGNLIYNIEESAISLEKQGNVRLVNNTVYNADVFINQLSNNALSVNAVNNIVVDMNGTQTANHMYFESPQVYSNSNFDNNLFWQSGADVIFDLGSNNNDTFSSTTEFEDSPFGYNNIIENPLFIDARNDDFRLKNNSPAIDSGSTSAVYQEFKRAYGINITRDKNNLARPQKTSWDIGAFEYEDNILPAPSHLTAAAVSTSQINLSWTDNSNNEEGFIIEYSFDGGVNYSELTTTRANVSSYKNTKLSKSTTYHYRIVSYNSMGKSAYSKSASAKTLAEIFGIASIGPVSVMFILLLAIAFCRRRDWRIGKVM